MGNVVLFEGVTALDLPADRVLENAPKDLESVVIIGFTADGEEYFSSSIANGPEVLWLLERAKKSLLATVENYSE